MSVNISPNTSHADCLIWAGAKTNAGYGHRTIRGVSYLAHRVAYEEAKGPIPAGMEIDHLCRNRACVEPSHLEVVSRRENVRRQAASRTHCPSGHPYAGVNLYLTRAGHRVCRECHRRLDRESKQRKASRDKERAYLAEKEPR